MPTPRKAKTASSSDLHTQLVSQLQILIHKSSNGGLQTENFSEVSMLLDCLPLNSHEFSVAMSRLQSAERYAVARENGAAHFELRLLLANLKHDRTKRELDSPRLLA